MAPSSLTFYTHGLCPYAHRVALALAWKNIEHERVSIDLSNKPSWYASRLGTTLVPAIELDGAPYAESLDIVRLCDKSYDDDGAHPSLTPADPKRAAACEELVRHGSSLERAGWSLLGGSWSFPKKGGPPSAAARTSWDAAVRVLEASLSTHGGPYLVGPSPTVADAALAPFIARFELAALVCRGFDAREASPALAAYLRTLEASEAWRATFPDRRKFGDAIQRYGSLDYFDYPTASLEEPLPR